MRHLLQTITDYEIGLFYIIIAIVSIVVFYLLIKAAVQAGTKRLHDQLFIQNRLLIKQMQREGATDEEIKQVVQREIPQA